MPERGAITVATTVSAHAKGKLGPVSRKKRAPRYYPVEPELTDVLRWHRARLVADKTKALSEQGIRVIGAEKAIAEAWIRYTFTDLLRKADVDPVLRRALVGGDRTPKRPTAIAEPIHDGRRYDDLRGAG
jgi:hypothetical protein